MACRIVRVWAGSQRTLAKNFQVLRIATAGAPLAQILLWAALTAAMLAGRSRPLNEVVTVLPAP
jgi:hypothetical protein